MTKGYLDNLFEHCDRLKLVLSPPHPQAFIQGRADQAQMLLAEIEQEIGEIEKQDAPIFQLVSLEGESREWVGFEPEIKNSEQDWLNTMEDEARAHQDELVASLGMTTEERA